MKNKTRKFMSTLLLLAMMVTTMVSNVFTVSAASVEDTDMQGWSWEDNDVSKATRVFENGNHMAKLSFTGKNTYFFRYDFSSYVESGHTYKVSAYIKVDTDATAGYLFFGSNWDCKNSDTSVLNYKAGKVVEFTDTAKKNRVRFGLDSNITADMYIDNIVITDITDSANPVVIDCFNTDFEESTTPIVEDTDMQGWSWTDDDVAKATRVFENGNHMAKLSFTGKNTYFFRYDFSSYVESGHTYKVSAYIKVDTDATAGYLFFGSNWDCKNSDTSVLNYKAGQVVEFTDTAKKNRVRFGLDSNITADMYIDNIVITDITDSANPVVIDCFNTDFEESTTPIVEDTDMQGWSWTDDDVAKATRVFENGNHMAKLSFTGKNTYFFRYDFSSYVESGHTYKVSAYIKVDTDATAGYLFFGSNWDCKNSDTSVLNYKAGKVVEFTDTAKKNRVRFGLDSDIVADMYIDNIVITDITDSANPVVIDCFNTDFESNLTEKIDFTKNNGGEATAEIISKNETYDIYLAWATYAVDEDGNKTLDNVSFEKKTITASDDVQSFTITPEIKAGYATKAFLWKADNLEPLAPALEFEAVESAE